MLNELASDQPLSIGRSHRITDNHSPSASHDAVTARRLLPHCFAVRLLLLAMSNIEFESAQDASTQEWLVHLREMLSDAESRFADVSWRTHDDGDEAGRCESKGGELLFGHKWVVYSRSGKVHCPSSTLMYCQLIQWSHRCIPTTLLGRYCDDDNK